MSDHSAFPVATDGSRQPETAGGLRATAMKPTTPWWSFVDRRLPVLLLLPAGVLLAINFLYPIAYTAYLSLHRWVFAPGPPPFVGLGNYVSALSDASVQASLVRTVVFVVGSLALQLGLGMVLAMLVSKLGRSRGLVTTLLVLPMMVTPVVVGLIWRFIFDYNFGILNQVIQVFGGPHIAFLSERSWAMLAVVLVETWHWTPFMFLLLLAGITSLPSEPYEAATVDGANARQQFIHLTLPMLRPVIIAALVLRFSGLVKEFDKIYVLTGGGPGSATEIASLFIQRAAFLEFNFGYAAGVAMILAGIVAIVSWFGVRWMHVEGDGR